MRPLSEVTIRPLRTLSHGDIAAVWTEASWFMPMLVLPPGKHAQQSTRR